MRPLTISSFTQARDNQANRTTIDFQELVKEFENPKILEDEASEELANKLKPFLPAWTPATYTDDTRANENVQKASCLVFDLDGKGKQGLDPDSIQPSFAYAIHSTTRSGFCPDGKAKLRLVIPLANDVDAVTYQRLWKHVVVELGIQEHVDSTRLHPGGIFFAPAIFAEHKERYVFRSNLELPWLDPAPKKKHAEFESVANSSEKHVALNKAAFGLAAKGVDDVEIREGLLEALRENGRRGSSNPVEDWDAAERTIDKAIKDGKQAKAENDELDAKIAQKRALTQQQADVTIKEILKLAKTGKLSFDRAAQELSPYKEKIDIAAELEKVWKDSKTDLKYSEFLDQVKLGLETPNEPREAWQELLDCDPKGNPKANRHNIMVLMKYHPELKGVAYNVRTQNVGHKDKFPWGGNVLQTHHGQLAALWAAQQFRSGDNFSPENTLRDLAAAARGKQYDPFTIWIEGLTCANDDEIYTKLCVDCLGAEPTEYNLKVLKAALVMTLQRQFVPGAKVDYMPILEGKQGIGKSTFLRQLFPPHLQTECYAVMKGDIEDRGNTNLLGMRVILEQGELDSMRKKEVTAFKVWLTVQEDQVRPLYSNITETVPRRAVCWGTTNEDEYLKDSTGNRRFWPIRIEKVDFNWLTQNREILWKTVHKDWLAGAATYPSQEEAERLFAPEQELRREADVIEDRVLPYLTDIQDWGKLGKLGVTAEVGQVVTGATMWWSLSQLLTLLELNQNDNLHVRRLTTALKRHGWGSFQQWVGGKNKKVWKKKAIAAPQKQKCEGIC